MLPEITTMPFEFLRPMWLLGIIAICLLSLLRYKSNNNTKQQALIAAHLSANLVSQSSRSNKQYFAFNSLAIIACISLAGPTWRSVDMPVYEMEKAQVIVFDLSYSMYATDIKPSRLALAKFKAIDLIKQWSEGEKALIAYAGDAFTVTPLTRDGNAIINHIPHLSPDIMPARGSRADIALDKAIELLENAGYNQGHIVFLSDGIDEVQSQQIQKKLKGTSWVVSILAIATQQGAPIKLSDDSLLKNSNGQIVVPKLVEQPLYDITRASNGLYLTNQNDSSDIKQLGDFFDDIKQKQSSNSESDKSNFEHFAIDDGYWLSFLLLPLFLLLFRKGVFFALVISVSIPFTSSQLEASETSVWRNTQQNAFQAFQDGDYQTSSELYQSPLEQGSALYKNKQYEQALTQFTHATKEQPDNANALYNQGNSYAQLQQFDKAIEAYDKALALAPAMQQASENKAIIEQLQDQQQESQQQQQDSEQQQDSQQDKQESEQQQESQQEQQNSEQQQESQQEQQNSEQQQDSQQEQQDSEQQQDSQQEQQNSELQQDSQQEQQQDSQQEQQEKESEQQKQKQIIETDADVNKELEALPDWLKNMPDDPSILLRRKMQLEYQKRAQSQTIEQQTNNGAIW